MRSLKLILLSLLGGVILFSGWPPLDSPLPLFIGFLPFLWLEEILRRQNRSHRYFWFVYPGLLTWNILCTWWVWFASPGGAIAMLLMNTLLMTLPFLFYSMSRNIVNKNRALVFFVLFWLGFEYLHHNWQISYPWLTLGNGFATAPQLVQFYEYTGVEGGSLWILLVNVLLFQIMRNPNFRISLGTAFVLIAPVLWSNFLWDDERKTDEFSFLVVQPNIDPYEKFNEGQELQQVRNFIDLVEPEITEGTQYIILPETAIVEYLDEGYMAQMASIQLLKELLRRHPGLKMITGASTYHFYPKASDRSVTARQASNDRWYDSYNTALMIDSNGVQEIYHKSRLVPGVERMPYPKVLGFLEYLSIDMGGISGSLGSDSEASSFNTNSGPGMAPLICYESVFGEYVGDFVNKGANILLVITNDGWWGNTPGYKQHMHYARLRAIEHRREVVRSANTGISCHIDANGNILQRTRWWERDVLKVKANANEERTFFTVNGDVIGKISSFLTVFVLIGLWVRRRIIKSGLG